MKDCTWNTVGNEFLSPIIKDPSAMVCLFNWLKCTMQVDNDGVEDDDGGQCSTRFQRHIKVHLSN